ncbi:site-specific integrase [Shewanella livingstonensis]|uniref:Site-specific integrase n=1 Tax=Shewanella livingstonensis TaxID=150120 RepID=A0A3G8LYP2_9GAMM|nr:site-specific integrase [Shewanella livingstonensis]AZG74809.1 site-specific integrase [Shewanella livingstonensis]
MSVTLLKAFERWDFYSPLDQKLKMVDASDTPFITYDNGIPCFEANMYMLRLLVSVMSRRVKGGTLRTYATHIHHLVRFCYQNKMNFSQLTDSTFTLFVNGLQAERDKFGELARSNNHVVQIAHRCLDFLSFVQNCHDLNNFIGEGNENILRVKIKIYKIQIEGSKHKREVEVISHASVPTKDAVKRRFPVSEESALKLWDYIKTQTNREKRLRDIALYQCLEQLGARITEIHLIKMKDIEDSLNSGTNPHLRLTTLKQRDHDVTRSIPVTRALLVDIQQYINKVRSKIIKRTIGQSNDHGYLFISLTTGHMLQSATLTKYMNIWKGLLGIEGELHPHLYRHAFITNKLKEIILQHKEINSADKFREFLLHTERFKMQLQQWVGQKNPKSLDRYINLVFADLNGYSKTYNAVQLNDSVKIVKRQVQLIRQQLEGREVTMTEGLLLIEQSLSAFERDIAQSLNESK